MSFFEYFIEYYIQLEFEWSYVAFDVAFILAATILLVSYENNRMGILRLALSAIGGWAVMVLIQCLWYFIFTTAVYIKFVPYLAVLVLFSATVCRYSVRVRITLVSAVYAIFLTFFCCIEPMGFALWELFKMRWLVYVFQGIIIAALFAVLFYLRRFAILNIDLPVRYNVTLIAISFMGVIMALLSIVLPRIYPSAEPDGYFLGSKIFQIFVFLIYILIECISYYALFSLAQEHKKRVESERINDRLSRDNEAFSLAQQNYSDIHMIKHDLNNQISYMNGLLSEGRYDELKKYFEGYGASALGVLERTDTGNRIIDSIINMEKTKAQLKNVKMECKIAVPPVFPFDDYDLCNLLTNLIDNALEACEADGVLGDGAGVTVDIRQDHNYALFHIENPIADEKKNESRKNLKTHKGGGHGYGVKIVRRITEKYNGYCEFNLNDNIFAADVMLPLEYKAKGEN